VRPILMAWRIFVNLATGGVILAMFHIANSRFETVVICALVLIYVSVTGSHLSLGYALSRKWNIDLARYIAISKSLHLSTEIEEESQMENLQEDQKSQSGFWINAGFNMFFGLVAIGNLVYALVSPV